ncbi:MAG: 30S ribosomal protein S2 [Candidatus Caenarcaniphilales bacterium]|nr:30S ribosomal protein S2 [Candidatus Caenarcaniphilales bacterium]
MTPETLTYHDLTEDVARQMLEAGVHYGQPTSKRSPRMDEFVYGVSKHGVQIIDLNITWQKIQEAGKLLQKLASEDKNILFVGTNERAVSNVLLEFADNHNINHITSRWLGGTLTNPVTRSRVNYLRELESMETSGLMESISAKEKSFVSKKLKKLRKNLGGLKNIRGAVHAIVILDPVYETNATLEALKKSRNMHVIAIADTNCNFPPENFDVIIPCNICSMRSLREVLNHLVNYIDAGKEQASTRSANISHGPSRRRSAGGPPSSRRPASAAPSGGRQIEVRDERTRPGVQDKTTPSSDRQPKRERLASESEVVLSPSETNDNSTIKLNQEEGKSE